MTTQYIETSIALLKSKNWEVVSASKKGYFKTASWKSRTIVAEKVDDKDIIIFILSNDDFIKVEK